MNAKFYNDRHLSAPRRELRPESREELAEALADAKASTSPWCVVGGGEHIRHRPDSDRQAAGIVIRTDAVDDVIDVDTDSGLIRVEAGIDWRGLGEAVADEGLTLQRYGLQPLSATVGGLLARRRPGPSALRGGSILDGCVAIGARDVEVGDYRYLTAPRKASGPDLRHEFIGAGCSSGAITDVTLVAWRGVESRLVRYDDCSLEDAGRIRQALADAAIAPTWIHYRHGNQALQFELAMPGRLLRARLRWLSEHVEEPDETGDAEDARTRRRWLEARHPDRRSHPDAEAMRVFWLAPSALSEDLAELFGDRVVDIEIPAWTPRRIEAYVTYDEPADARRFGLDDALFDDGLWASWPVLSNLDDTESP